MNTSQYISSMLDTINEARGGSMLPEDWAKLRPADKRKLRTQAKQRSRGGMSMRDLYKSMQKFRKGINETGKVEILDIRVSKTKVPYLIVEAQVRGTKLWQQTFHFVEAVLEDQPQKGFVPLAAGHGQYWWLRPVKVDESAKCRCSCPDDQHTFYYQRHGNNALQGRRIPYQKVAGSNRGPRNPQDIPGVCKHLRAVVHELQKRSGRNQLLEPIPGSFTTAKPGYQWR